jgi:tetratricopeptide (TPR) repeat protein
VYAASADGSGAGSTLGSIDKVTSELRGKLGEALESIQKNSVSLPNVTTSSLDALKAYAIGRQYSASGDLQRAKGFLEQALKLDPNFGLAAISLGGVYLHGLADYRAAARYFALAQRLRHRLPPRDALRLDVAIARTGPPGPAIEKIDQLLALYPDALDEQLTAAQLQLWDRNDATLALAHAKAASVPQARRIAVAHYMQGIALVALERPAEAIAQFERSRMMGYDGARYSHAYAYAMRRDWAGVARVLEGRRFESPIDRVDDAEYATLFAADRRQWDEAIAQSRRAVELAADMGPLLVADARVRQLAVETAAGRTPAAALAARIRGEMATLDANAAQLDAELPRGRMFALLALGDLAARVDDAELVRASLRAVAEIPDAPNYPLAVQLQAVLAAELERIEGMPGDATRRLRALADRGDALALVHATLARCELAAGDRRGAAAQDAWLAAHRGRAYVERPAEDMLTVLSVVDSTPPPRP